MQCALCIALLAACARMGTPDGGPYDETPPKVVRTSPKMGAANETRAKKIVIEFDEFIKIDNAMEKVVISPPQIEQPEIEANGRKVTINLIDSLKPNMTYTIDFADAIVDNNEGNPYGDFAFTFSTGESVDTFQVSGYVLDASNLEPIKGILVGLYKLDSISSTLPDSIFKTRPFERISRTDSRGHFVIKGLSPGQYRSYALKDLNQNYLYDQQAEMVAFSNRILSTSCKPDIRPDTIWHDSIHYDSIVMVPYTHYYPDDIALLAFEPSKQDRHLLKSERPILEMFKLFFTAASDTLPRLTGLNFDATDAFIVDANQRKDSLDYWIRDSLIYQLDTLVMQIDYFETDTTGQLSITTDTLRLISKISKERIARQQKEKYEEWVKTYKQRLKEERRAARRAERAKAAASHDDDSSEESESSEKQEEQNMLEDKESQEHQEEQENREEQENQKNITPPDSPENSHQQEKADEKSEKKSRKKKKNDDEDIEIPPMPEVFLSFKTSNIQSMDPDKNIDFIFEEPLDTFVLSKLHFSMKVDSLFQPAPFLFRQVPGDIKRYRLYAEWEADSTYQIEIDTAAFVNIYGKRNEATKRLIRMRSLDSYSTLFVTLQGQPALPDGQKKGNWDGAIVELLSNGDKVVKSIPAKNNHADFYFITPGTYYLRLFHDLNGNGTWDTGDYDLHRQPEPVYYYPGELMLKAQWEITQQWNPTATPYPQQKPLKITKQKPDKEKTIKNRNAQRPTRK